MKFLAFNALVGIALIYLFAGDRFELTTAIDRAKDTVSKVVPTVTRTAAPTDAAPTPSTPIANSATARPSIPAEVAEAVPVSTTTSAVSTPTKLSPAVARRRDEVLGNATPTFKQNPPDVASSTPDRRQRLLDIAERMELFHLNSVGR